MTKLEHKEVARKLAATIGCADQQSMIDRFEVVISREYATLLTRCERLEKALKLSNTRLGICAGRMRACNEESADSGRVITHELIDEVDDWVAEAESLLREGQ